MNRPKPKADLQPIRVITPFPLWINDSVIFYEKNEVIRSQAAIAAINRDFKLKRNTRELKQ